MKIKKIKNEIEVKKVVDLFIKVFSEHPYNEIWTKKQALKRLTEIYQRGKDFCFYAEEKNIVVGLIFCQTQTWEEGVHVIIEDTAVDSNMRSKGIGELLVKELEKVAKNKNISSIDLLSNTKSKAINFWAKQKYKKNGYIQFMKKIK